MPMACLAIAIAGLCCAKTASSADFLTPLPIQDLTAGERYTLGIRPSRAVARRTLNSKIDLYAEGLSSNASFHMVGDEIWELSWSPTSSDSGVHSVRILVTERGRPTEVIEEAELTFVVNGVPTKPSTPSNSNATDANLASTPAVDPSVTDQVVQPVSALASVDLDATAEADTILVLPANTEGAAPVAETSDPVLPESEKPTWSLAGIASRVVTPHQWVRFPVELISESANVGDFVAVQVDSLPNGATFDENDDGTRQFQWRPVTADGGEHVLNFTAVDTEDSEQRQTVTMRIIVQE